jgi:hypothetical protein
MSATPGPAAWRLHPDDAAQLAAERQHCEARRCRNPVAVTTWRYYRWQGQVLVAEHLVCDEHGQEFARRYRVTIEPAPAERVLGDRRVGSEVTPRATRRGDAPCRDRRGERE